MTESTEAVNPMWTSYSAMSQHRVCPQRWNYARHRKLEKIENEDVAVERDFGSWWHMLRAADSLARGRKLGSLKWVPEKLTSVDHGPELTNVDTVVPADVVHAARLWWDKQTPLTRDTWAERLGEGLVERLINLFGRWSEEWEKEIQAERPLAVEMQWVRDLPMPAGCRPVSMIGYVDEAYFDTTRNILVMRDDKAAKRLSSQTSADDMMDSQLQFYAWGAAPAVKPWGLGQIQATAYDRARMVKPTTPVVTGGGSLSKSVSDYDLDTYLDWAAGPDPMNPGVPWGEEGVFYVSGKRTGEPKFGRYTAEESVIEKLSTPAARSIWFQRTLTPLNRNVVRTHLQAGVESAMDIQRTIARVEKTRTAGRNLGNCRFCDFQKLCRAEMFGGTGGDYDLGDMGLRQR